MLIVIDPGHGGKDPGAIYQGIQEKDLNLAISKSLQKYLEYYGFKTKFTRDDDRALSLKLRCTCANVFGADLFISVHCNAFKDSKVSGFEVHYYEQGKEIAQTISDNVFTHVQIDVRKVKQSNFIVLKHTLMPAVLLECGFMSNDSDLKKLTNASFREQLAKSIVLGLIAHYF
jgi:N-acetylmuramoyl-L-alanine amidase